jgi:hypothetical protein
MTFAKNSNDLLRSLFRPVPVNISTTIKLGDPITEQEPVNKKLTAAVIDKFHHGK